MSDAEQVQQALAELWDIVRCRCHEAYTGRGLHDPDCQCDSTDALQIVTHRIEALTKKRDEQIEWVKRLADDLISAEAKLATCERYRDAYAECDRIGTQAVRDLEAKLAKAVEALEEIAGDGNAAGRNPQLMADKARATLAEIKGESHDPTT